MARDYARIMTAIWDNPEFCALDEREQRAYILLITQKDISAAGILRLWVPRWAEMSSSSTVESLTQALKGLETRRFIIVDWTTGELLVRSFVRWDGGFTNSKRKPVIVRAGREVRSEAIKQELRIEFRRCNLTLDATPSGPPDGPSGGHPIGPPTPIRVNADRASDALSAHQGSEPPIGQYPQVDTASHATWDALGDTPSDATPASDGVVGTQVSSPVPPQPNNPQPVPPPAGDESPLPDNWTVGQRLVAHYIDQCRKRPPGPVIGQLGKLIAAMLEEGIDQNDIRTGIDAWAAKGLHPAALPAVVNEVMNSTRPPALRVVNGFASAPRRTSTTTERFQAALEHLDPEGD